MSVLLGLDIGTNSVGSAWVDTDREEVHLGVSVFPAGVDEQETRRGDPKNQARRQKRSQRRSLARRAARKRHLRTLLLKVGLLPTDPAALTAVFGADPWQLRRRGLSEPLSPHEFGRVLVHLAQRRGALGIQTDPDDPEEGKVKEAIDRLDRLMKEREAQTVGQLFADLIDERQSNCPDKKPWREPVRNRQYRMSEQLQLYASRKHIHEEFKCLWDAQRSFGGPLAEMLTPDLRLQLDNPEPDDRWRHRGCLFGQRRTYWSVGALGRCDLEPADRCAPLADMHAQRFRVLETVNNIRLTEKGGPERSLTAEERQKVIAALSSQKTGSTATVRKALGIDKKAVRGFYTLNIERDDERVINTDWFHREIAAGVWGEQAWQALTAAQQNSVNRALLKFDPDNERHQDQLRLGAGEWWGLDSAGAERLVAGWRTRPRLEQRVKLSCRAIRNLLPYMDRFDEVAERWPTQIEARQRFAADPQAIDQTTGQPATGEQAQRYALGARPLTKAERRFLAKHAEPLPPAPMLANPVVRKAIHEVRRHIVAWWRRFGRIPDRIVIEYVRSATQPAAVCDRLLNLNRRRNRIRMAIVTEYALESLPRHQQDKAVNRVLLCRQQKGMCPYCADENPISELAACEGQSVEIDHIIPESRSQNNGLNNKVLCHRACNRGKGSQTPKEWLGAQAAEFRRLEQRLEHLGTRGAADDYFTDRDCTRKWENLHLDAPSMTEFLASQFTDTAYAARRVSAWLRDTLYSGEGNAQRRVFTTKGTYTAILRRDWGLSESDLDRAWHAIELPGAAAEDSSSGPPRKGKDRSDHIHHAIDAVCIALSPDRMQDLARYAEAREKGRAGLGEWPRRRALRPPWPVLAENATPEQLQAATAGFRRQVLAVAHDGLVVAHRPVKRKIVGRLHKETQYGPVFAATGERVPDRVTIRQPICEGPLSHLKPAHLAMPVLESREDAIKRVQRQLTARGLGRDEAREQAALTVDRPGYKPRWIEPRPGKSGIVRDFALRRALRSCLQSRGLDPDAFTYAELAKTIKERGPLEQAKGGVPIKSAVLLWANSDPVAIQRRVWNAATGRMETDTDPRTLRLYDSQNNHHIEIREVDQTRRGQTTTEWVGEVVTMFEAARRVRTEKRPAVDRSDSDKGRFVMSLAEGETLHMRHPVTGQPGYFVVFKLVKPSTVHLVHHWDARSSKTQRDARGHELPNSQREDVGKGSGGIGVAELRTLGVEPGLSPTKVWVSPLGEVRPLHGD